MRTVAVLVVVFAAYAAAVPVPEDQADYEYPRFIQFPDGNGILHTVDLQEEPDYKLLEDVERNPANNLYLLFTRNNRLSPQTLTINDVDSINNSNFDPSHPTVVIVHGWLSNQNTDINPVIRNGLDPAGPLWNMNSNRLGPDDGVYVEAIHTDGGYTVGGLGIGTAIADADFFPNGGISQPRCLTNVCNHNRAWELFAATVSYNHLVGQECTSSLQITMNTCKGQDLHMGNDDLTKSGSGMYRVNTGRRYPF